MKISRYIHAVLPATLLLAAATACSGSGSDTEARAQEMYARADSALKAGDYTTSLQILAELDTAFPDAFETRRQAMAMRPRAIEQQCLTEISRAQTDLALVEQELATVTPLMKTVSTEGLLEPYSVVADAYNPSFISQTTAEPRVDNDGNYYVVAQVTGTTAFGLKGVRLSTSTGEIIDSQFAPKGRAVAEGGSELLSLRMEEVDTLGSRAYNADDRVISLSLVGDNGTKDVKVTPKQAKAFGTAWRYSRLLRDRRALLIKLELLERTLQTARTQIANFPQENTEVPQD